MENYYAVERSGDHLAHYGVKGMKWGVRKAIAKGSERKLGRVYKKAQKKLYKLQRKADTEVQDAIAKVQGRKALKTGLKTAAVGGLGVGALRYGLKQGSIKPVYGNGRISVEGKLSENLLQKRGKITGISAKRTADLIGLAGAAAGTLAGAAKTAHHARKAAVAKYRTTKKGHAKAVAKAERWQNEMNKAFAGTKYGNPPSNRITMKTKKKRGTRA